MSVVFVGAVSVGGAIGGLSPIFLNVTAALGDLKAAVDLQASLLLDAKASIRIAALADLQAQLNAALSIGVNLQASISDPTLYLEGLLQGMIQVQANISALVPSVAVSATISANAAIAVGLTAKIAAFDLVLNALLTIQLALTAAISAVLGAINAALSIAAVLPTGSGAGGVQLFVYEGLLSGLGAAIDAQASVDTGFSGSLPVYIPIMIVDSSVTATKGALQTVLGTP